MFKAVFHLEIAQNSLQSVKLKKIDKSKTVNLNKYLDDKYGKKGTETRANFMEKADAFYYKNLAIDQIINDEVATK